MILGHVFEHHVFIGHMWIQNPFSSSFCPCSLNGQDLSFYLCSLKRFGLTNQWMALLFALLLKWKLPKKTRLFTIFALPFYVLLVSKQCAHLSVGTYLHIIIFLMCFDMYVCIKWPSCVHELFLFFLPFNINVSLDILMLMLDLVE